MVFMLSLVVYSLAFLCSPQQRMACCADCKNAFILKNKNNFYLTFYGPFLFVQVILLRHRYRLFLFFSVRQRISLSCDVASCPPEVVLPHTPFFAAPERFHSAGQRGQLRILGVAQVAHQNQKPWLNLRNSSLRATIATIFKFIIVQLTLLIICPQIISRRLIVLQIG